MNINEDEIKAAQKDNNWVFSNNILYEMCKKNPTHTDIPVIMGKIYLIGRAYSASIERRKGKEEKDGTDIFYENKVAPQIKKSNIDEWLDELRLDKSINEKNMGKIIKTHSKVMKLFNEISGMNKRSLASKYLHFHLPELFYIYDSRAVEGFRVILPSFRIKDNYSSCDKEYSKFFQKMYYLHSEIKEEYDLDLNTRQLDKLLLLKAAL